MSNELEIQEANLAKQELSDDERLRFDVQFGTRRKDPTVALAARQRCGPPFREPVSNRMAAYQVADALGSGPYRFSPLVPSRIRNTRRTITPTIGINAIRTHHPLRSVS